MKYHIAYTETYRKNYSVIAKSYDEAGNIVSSNVNDRLFESPCDDSGNLIDAYCELITQEAETPEETIENYKYETNYFTECIPESDIYEMFRHRLQFGEAETQVIIAALKLAGAKFKN